MLADGSRLVPDPILVGRDPARLAELAAEAGIDRWTSDLDAALRDPGDAIYFDALPPAARGRTLRAAIEAGKHVYAEKPLAGDLSEAAELLELARRMGVKHAVVCDKLWAPGIAELLRLGRENFFGRILMVRIEGCHWAFEGRDEPLQRPSWNFRKDAGGGIAFDILPHYFNIFSALAGAPLDVVAHGGTLVRERWDEAHRPYEVDVEDTILAVSRLPGGALAQVTCSWALRVRRDDVITVQVDGTEGSAVAGLSECHVQTRDRTTRAHWGRESSPPLDYRRDWETLPQPSPVRNPFRVQWEHFLLHVVQHEPFPWDMEAGVAALRFAAGCLTSWKERRWVDLRTS